MTKKLNISSFTYTQEEAKDIAKGLKFNEDDYSVEGVASANRIKTLRIKRTEDLERTFNDPRASQLLLRHARFGRELTVSDSITSLFRGEEMNINFFKLHLEKDKKEILESITKTSSAEIYREVRGIERIEVTRTLDKFLATIDDIVKSNGCNQFVSHVNPIGLFSQFEINIIMYDSEFEAYNEDHYTKFLDSIAKDYPMKYRNQLWYIDEDEKENKEVSESDIESEELK